MLPHPARTLTPPPPPILRYDRNECCRPGPSGAGSGGNWSDLYFQQHLYMGVMPMIPFPGNDHAILGPDPVAAAVYVRYGPMLAAVAPKVWALLPHILSVTNSSGSTFAKANAFLAPLGDAAQDSALLFPVVLGLELNGTAVLNLTQIGRAWPAAGPRASAHPLVRARARAREERVITPVAASYTYFFEAMWPGGGAAWDQLQSGAEDSLLLRVQLVDGAALVRARRVPSL